MVLLAIMRSWGRGMMMSINGSRCGMVGWSWGVNVRCRGDRHGMVRNVVVFYGINNRPTTEGDEKYR